MTTVHGWFVPNKGNNSLSLIGCRRVGVGERVGAGKGVVEGRGGERSGGSARKV